MNRDFTLLTPLETDASSVLGGPPSWRAALLAMGRVEMAGLWPAADGPALIIPDLRLVRVANGARVGRLRTLSAPLAAALLERSLVRHMGNGPGGGLAPVGASMAVRLAIGSVALQYGRTEDLAAFSFGPLSQFLLYAGRREGWPAANWAAVRAAATAPTVDYRSYHLRYLGKPRELLLQQDFDDLLHAQRGARIGRQYALAFSNHYSRIRRYVYDSSNR